MRGQGFLVLVALAALALALSRGLLRGLVVRLRLAFLVIFTLLAVSFAVRGVMLGQPLWAAAVLAIFLPSLVLAWRDFLRR